MQTEVLEYFDQFSGEKAEIFSQLLSIIQTFPMLKDKISYGIPFFYGKRWICYLAERKTGEVELAFPRGVELDIFDNVLLKLGRKQVRSLLFSSLDEIDKSLVIDIISEAVALDSFNYKIPKR